MSDDGNKLPDSDALTLAGLPSAPSGIVSTKTPPPSSHPSDAPTVFDLVPPSSRLRTTSPEFEGLNSADVFQEGTVLGGRYKILRVLGQGGMGSVYQARDQELDRVIALKVIRPELASNPGILQRFKQELILSRNVTHKNVVRIYDMGEAGGTKFITMEYVDGEDLRGLLSRIGKLTPSEAVDVIQQIGRALEAAHAEGVIHRDLKPQNVMRDPQGRVVVMDFGLARSLEAPGMTQTGALVGTLEYMSPEQAMGSELDQRSDIFALGLIFFELLAGKVPYKADTAIASLMRRTQERAIPVCDLDNSVPKSLSAIVSRCLERDRNDRFQNARELLQQLDAWIGNPSITTAALSRISLLSGASPAASRSSTQISLTLPNNRGWIWVGAVAAVVVLFFVLPWTRHLLFRPSSPGCTRFPLPN